MIAKKSVTFRLSETTIKELESLAKREKISQADVLAVIVHCVYAFGDVEDERLAEWFEIARIS